jgi:hypothetical protein
MRCALMTQHTERTTGDALVSRLAADCLTEHRSDRVGAPETQAQGGSA